MYVNIYYINTIFIIFIRLLYSTVSVVVYNSPSLATCHVRPCMNVRVCLRFSSFLYYFLSYQVACINLLKYYNSIKFYKSGGGAASSSSRPVSTGNLHNNNTTITAHTATQHTSLHLQGREYPTQLRHLIRIWSSACQYNHQPVYILIQSNLYGENNQIWYIGSSGVFSTWGQPCQVRA